MPTYQYNVASTWNGSGSPGVNVWHLRTVGINPGNIDLNDAIVAVGAFHWSLVQGGFLPNGFRYIGESTAVDVATREEVAVTGFTTDQSTGPATFSAPSMAVVGLKTSSATRSGRGRKFIGPLSTGSFDEAGTLTAGVLLELRTAADTLVDASDSANDWAVGVYSVQQSLLRDVVSAPVRDSVAILRSRRD